MKTLFRRCLRAFFLFSPLLTLAVERGSSAPYISGDSFRASCDFAFDELSNQLNPLDVKEGNTIFVSADYRDDFFKHIHPLISSQYILVTHNGDEGIPKLHKSYLDDPKMIAWFGQNMEESENPKIHPIPIGIANRQWAHGNVSLIKSVQRRALNSHKSILLYMNFAEDTYLQERKHVANLFKNKPYCQISPPKEFRSYLQDLAQAKFVLSPRGNGLDCHRTWEALLMGSIPIVRSSPLDSMYENLPVLIVSAWEEINEEFLIQKYEEIQNKKYSLDKAYLAYWVNLINSYKPNHSN